MTSVLLVRHAYADHLADRRIAGRAAGLRLGARGRAEAEALAELLASAPLAAVYTSPLERARETAAPLAHRHHLGSQERHAFTEIDFGTWTGRSYDELASSDDWRLWNTVRTAARPPGGESMTEVLHRALEGLREITERHGDGTVAVVSHGDVIRGLLAHFMGMSLDHILRIEVDTASVSIMEVGAHAARIVAMNRTAHLPWTPAEEEPTPCSRR